MKIFIYIACLLQIVFADSGYYQNPFDFKPSSLPISTQQKKPSAIQPNVQKKSSSLVNEINVMKFGAVADGKTDNTDVFRDAIKKCKRLYIPEGNYLISDTINIPANTELIYGKGKIKGAGEFGVFRVSNTIHNLTIEGLTFSPEYINNKISAILYFDGGSFKNIRIKNCTFNGGQVESNAITLVARKPDIIDGFIISNNQLLDIQRAAIEILHRTKEASDIDTIKNIIIEKNTFTCKKFRSNSENFHVAISLSDRINGTIIRENYINGYRWGIETSKTINTSITGNTIYNASDAINSNSGTIGSIIKNNKLQSFYRLQFYGDSGTVMSGNEIDGVLYFLKVNGMSVRSNTIYTNTSKMSVVFDNSTNIQFNENYIENNTPEISDAIRGYGYKSDKSNVINNNKLYLKYGNVAQRNTNGASITIDNNTILSKPAK